MGQYNEMIITNEGLSLLAKAQLEAGSMIFTSVKTGNGTYNGSEDLRSEISLKSVKNSFQVSSVEQEDSSKLKLRCLLSNDEVSIGYDISEIGVYGKIDQSEEEKMIGIATAVKPDFFPSHDVSPSSILFEIYIKIANCNNVNFEYTIPEGVYELAQNAEEKYNRFAEHIANKNNPHNVTAEGIGAAEADHTHANATTTAAGFMSAEDKAKLDGVAKGANKTTVDAALSTTSTNPVQNKVITAALNECATSAIVTSGDFNNITTPGVYAVYGCSNSPLSSGGNYGVIVLYSTTGDSYVEQIAVRQGTYDIYIRYLVGGTSWGEWKKMLTVKDISQSTAITTAGTYALDAVQNNASVRGTLANRIKAVEDTVGKVYSKTETVYGSGAWKMSGGLTVPAGTYIITRKGTNINGAGVSLGCGYNALSFVTTPADASTGIYTDIVTYTDSSNSIYIYYCAALNSTINLEIKAVRIK